MSSEPMFRDRLFEAAWSKLLRNAVLPFGDRLFGHGMIRRLRFLEGAQWWDRDRIDRYRSRRLKHLLTVAYEEVPFYHDRFDCAGVHPKDMNSPTDLQHLPVATKQMLRDAYPENVTRETGQHTYEAATSGSTGKNFIVREDSKTAGQYRAAFMLALRWSGWQVGRAHMQFGITPTRNLERALKDVFLRCRYVPAFRLDDDHLDKHLDVLERRGIEHVWGFPAAIYHLSSRARKLGWNLPLKSVVTWGDKLFRHQRDTIEAVFQTRVFDTYGTGEGIQVAAQCGHGQAYHVHMLDTIVEYLDDDGQPSRPGQPGYVVLTRLHPGPMPLIRYRVGDVATRGANGTCPCGRHLDLMQEIQGREADTVVTPDGNRLIIHFFTGLLEHVREIDEWQIVQEDYESLRLRVVPTMDLSAETVQSLVRLIHDNGGRGLRVDVEKVDAIPVTRTGKRRLVVSRLENEADAIVA